MIQDIHPHHFDNRFSLKEPGEGDCVIALRGGRVLLADAGDQATIPDYAMLSSKLPALAGNLMYLFSVDDRAFHLLRDGPEALAGYSYHDPQVFRNYQPSWMAFAGATGCHLGVWYAKNRHCGVCGGVTRNKGDERALCCCDCGETVYPRISPAVIVAIVDGDRILTTKYANRPGARAALVAGFMEIGETLEDTVRREVMEEVGVRVSNIRYYKSQPWAFSGSVLTGFFADLDGSPQITLDAAELQEADWVRREELSPPELNISLTAEMIDVFRRGCHPR